MPRFVYDKERSCFEFRLAKAELKEFYRWRFGYKVPSDWTADHQVEQSIYLYERFGGGYIHNISNMLMVPPEINIGKNCYYGKPWIEAPSKYRKKLPRTIEIVTFPASPTEKVSVAQPGECVEVRRHNPMRPPNEQRPNRPLAIREVLYMYSLIESDRSIWSLQEEFSKDVIRLLDKIEAEGRWKSNQPEWLQRFPRWLERFREDVETHVDAVSDYIRYKRG